MVAKRVFNSIVAFVLAVGLMVPIVSLTAAKAYAAPDKPTGLTLDGTILRWDAASGADDYWVGVYDSSECIAYGVTTNNYYDFTEILNEYGSCSLNFYVSARAGEESSSSSAWFFFLLEGDTEVTSIGATITAPKAGKAPDMNPVSLDSSKYSVEECEWFKSGTPGNPGELMEGGDVFESGNTYIVAFRFKAVDGYALNTHASDSQVTLNGETGGYNSGHTRAYQMWYRFALTVPPLCEVTFDSNGGSNVNSQTVDAGDTAWRPFDPDRLGWYFDTWCSDSALTKPFDFDTPITKDTTLYARWYNALSVRAYDSTTATEYSGGTVSIDGGNPRAGIDTSLYENASVTLTAIPDSDYVFVKWTKGSPTGTTLSTSETLEFAYDGTTNCYAVFAKKPTHNVTFVSNGGSPVDSQTVVDGGTAVEPADPSRAGWTFDAWCSDSALTSIFSFDTVIEADTELYARWSTNYTVQVYNGTDAALGTGGKLRVSGTSRDVTSVTLKGLEDESVTVTAKPDEGYHFVKWVEGSVDGSTASTNANLTFAVTGEVTYYAIFEKDAATTYTVTFDANGHGTAPDAQTVNSGDTAVEPTAPTESGWSFGGWYTEAACSNAFDFSTSIEGNITLYAKWEEAPEKYPIIINIGTFDKNDNLIAGPGGTAVADKTEVGKGETVTVTVTTNTGFMIKEISFSNGITGSQIGLETSWTVPDDFQPATEDRAVVIDVTFKEIPPVTHKVDFETYGGSPVQSQTVEDGDLAVQPEAPTRAGYVFDAWYTDATYTTKYDFSTGVTGDITLHARWMYKAVGFTMNVTGTDQDGSNYVLTTDAQTVQFEGDATTYTFSAPVLYTDAACSTLLTTPPEKGTTYYALVGLESTGDEGKPDVLWSDDMKSASTATVSNGATMAYADLARSPGGKYATIIFSYTEPVVVDKYKVKVVVTTRDVNDNVIAGPGGTATADKTEIAKGETVNVTATPAAGFALEEISFGNGGTPYQTGMETSYNVTDEFTPLAEDPALVIDVVFKEVAPATYTVTVSDDGNGTATASATSGTQGTEITLTATPNSGYQFKEWQVISGGVAVSDDKFAIGTADVEVKAIFEKIPPKTYSISYDLNGGALDGKTGVVVLSIEEGTTITLPKPTRAGYVFDYWEGSHYEAGASYTVEGDHSFKAQWKEVSNEKEKNKIPNTADDTPIALCVSLAAVSLLGLAVALFSRRRNRA